MKATIEYLELQLKALNNFTEDLSEREDTGWMIINHTAHRKAIMMFELSIIDKNQTKKLENLIYSKDLESFGLAIEIMINVLTLHIDELKKTHNSTLNNQPAS